MKYMCNYIYKILLTLYVAGLPEVIVTPFNQSIEVSLAAKFIATVKGVGPFTYQWQRGRRNLKNKVQSTLLINEVSVQNENYYICHVTNNYGDSTHSNRAFLQVTGEFVNYC